LQFSANLLSASLLFLIDISTRARADSQTLHERKPRGECAQIMQVVSALEHSCGTRCTKFEQRPVNRLHSIDFAGDKSAQF
jgi:hypothetical protein